MKGPMRILKSLLIITVISVIADPKTKNVTIIGFESPQKGLNPYKFIV
jgi:hypothetical protein